MTINKMTENTMSDNEIIAAWDIIYDFNDIAENFDNVDEFSIDNQISFIFSELTETITAFEAKDAVELLDGACDVFVTAVGLLQKLEAAGFNVSEAIKRVNANNMSKYIPDGVGRQFNSEFTARLNPKHNVWVIRDNMRKIRKPETFKPVSLQDLVPDKAFFEKAS